MSSARLVGWIVTNWRLKLLSLVLSVGLLSPVAFSQNPPMFDSVPVRVEYRNLPSDLVIVNPTTSVKVDVAGFRDSVQAYRQSAAGVTIDMSRAHPGTHQRYEATPRQTVSGLSFRESSIPIWLTIEPLATRQLDIAVRTSRRAAGIAIVSDRTYATCGNANDRCQVSVTGPASLVNVLGAYVDYNVPLTTASTGSSPNQPIQFEKDGQPIDLSRTPTIPAMSWTPDFVTVVVTTQGGTQTKAVPVSVNVVGQQPCGYQISAIDVQPNQVTVTGPVDAVSKLTSVSMSPIVLSGLTTSERITRTVVTEAGGVTSDPQQVVANVSVTQAFSCAAPTPAPGGGPAPPATATPTATPRPSPSPT